MSNVSYASPYENDSTSNSGYVPERTGPGLIETCAEATFRALCTVAAGNETTRAQLSDAQHAHRAELLKRGDNPGSLELGRFCSQSLHLRCADTLLEAAQSAGFGSEQVFTAPSGERATLLMNSLGDRLVVSVAPEQPVRLYSDRTPEAIHSVVRQHTLNQVVRHSKELGLDVETVKRKDGTVEVRGSEPKHPAKDDGNARVRVEVHNDGRSTIDVDGIVGNRCERISEGFANSSGAAVVKKDYRSSYFARRRQAKHIENRGGK